MAATGGSPPLLPADLLLSDSVLTGRESRIAVPESTNPARGGVCGQNQNSPSSALSPRGRMPSHQRVVDGGRIKGGGNGAKRFQHGETMFDDRVSGVNCFLTGTRFGCFGSTTTIAIGAQLIVNPLSFALGDFDPAIGNLKWAPGR